LINPSSSNYSFIFAIAAPSTVLLSFGYIAGADPADASDEDYWGSGLILDNIRVAVPEPSVFSLLAVGLGGLAMMRRRRS
jgi:hypothetical protein